MLNNENNNCVLSDDIVSYIYDEMDLGGRAKFESHLVSCTNCTDQFALISDARFSMFEYRKEEFAHLPTPAIVIPYPATQRVGDIGQDPGWFAGLTAVFAFARSPLAVGAALALLMGLGFVARSLIIPNEDSLVASNSRVPAVQGPAVVPVAEIPKTSDSVFESENVAIPDMDKMKSVRASVPAQPRSTSKGSANRRPAQANIDDQNLRQAKRAPVLSQFAEDTDDSLRLSDMFDEIGG